MTRIAATLIALMWIGACATEGGPTEAELCSDAQAHLDTCFPQTPARLVHCTAADAEEVLSHDCSALTNSKADGWLCDTLALVGLCDPNYDRAVDECALDDAEHGELLSPDQATCSAQVQGDWLDCYWAQFSADVHSVCCFNYQEPTRLVEIDGHDGTILGTTSSPLCP